MEIKILKKIIYFILFCCLFVKSVISDSLLPPENYDIPSGSSYTYSVKYKTTNEADNLPVTNERLEGENANAQTDLSSSNLRNVVPSGSSYTYSVKYKTTNEADKLPVTNERLEGENANAQTDLSSSNLRNVFPLGNFYTYSVKNHNSVNDANNLPGTDGRLELQTANVPSDYSGNLRNVVPSGNFYTYPIKTEKSTDPLNRDALSLDFLLSPIQTPDYPSAAVETKNWILNYVKEHQIDITPAIESLLDSYKGLSNVEIMILVLSQLKSDLSGKCALKRRINRLLNYLSSCEGSTSVLDKKSQSLLLNRLSKTILQPDYSSPIIQNNYFYLGGAPFPSVEPVNGMVEALQDITQTLLTRLDSFESEKGKRASRTIEDDYVLPSIIPVTMNTISPPTTTTMIPTTIEATAPPPPPFEYLIRLLPTPKNDNEEEYYRNMVLFLSRPDLLDQLGYFDIHEYKSENDLLRDLLAKAITLQLSPEERAAIKFYLEYEVSLARLSLITKKQIQKQFDLSGIILDTINFEALNLQQRDAFDKFFHFIVKINGDDMKKFEQWTEAKTKGEFMIMLFKYFLGESFVSDDIKESIEVLIPLVKTTDQGAQPV